MWKRDKVKKLQHSRDGGDTSGSVFTRVETSGTGSSSPSPTGEDLPESMRGSPPETPSQDAAIAGQLVVTSFAVAVKDRERAAPLATASQSNIFVRVPIGPAQGKRIPITFIGEEFTDWCIQRGGVSKRGAKTVAKWMLNNLLFFETNASAGLKFSSSTEYCLNDEMLDFNVPKVVLQAKTASAIEMLSKPSLHLQVHTPANTRGDGDIIFTAHKKKSADNRVHAGTVDRLVEKLTTDGRPDNDFRDAFLFTYSTFMSLEELFMKLKSRWFLQPPAGSSDPQTRIFESAKRKPVRIRVLNVLKTLIEFIPELFEEEHPRLLMEEFIGTVHNTMSVVAADQLRHLLRHHVDAVPNMEDDVTDSTRYEAVAVMVKAELENAPPLAQGKRPGTFLTLKGRCIEDVAKQMALVDHTLWKSLTLHECLFKRWTKKVKPGEAPQAPVIRKLTDRFNMVAAWVGCMVVRHVRLVDRARELANCISLAHNLTELQDFFAAMAIMAGLNGSSVNRLYKTWEKLEADEYSMYETLKETYSSTGNYKNYRQLLTKVKPPCTPYIGLFLKDLVFIEDGNPDSLEEGRLINFQKKMQLAAVLKQIRRLQAKYYTQQPGIAMVRELVLLPSLGDTESYIRSKRLEPREPYAAIEHLNIKEDEACQKFAVMEARLSELEEAAQRHQVYIGRLEAALRKAGLPVPILEARPEPRKEEPLEDRDLGWTQAKIKKFRAPALRQGASFMGLKSIHTSDFIPAARKSDPVPKQPPASDAHGRVSSPEILAKNGPIAKKEPKAAFSEPVTTDALDDASDTSDDDEPLSRRSTGESGELTLESVVGATKISEEELEPHEFPSTPEQPSVSADADSSGEDHSDQESAKVEQLDEEDDVKGTMDKLEDALLPLPRRVRRTLSDEPREGRSCVADKRSSEACLAFSSAHSITAAARPSLAPPPPEDPAPSPPK